MEYPWTKYEKSLNERFPKEWNPGDILVKADDINGYQYYFNGLTLVSMEFGQDEDIMDSMKDVKFMRMATAITNDEKRELDVLKVVWQEGHLSDDQALKVFILLHSSSKEDRTLGVKLLDEKFLKVKDHVDLQRN